MNFYITIGDIQNRIAEFHQNNDMTPDFPEILRSLYKDHKYKAETPELPELGRIAQLSDEEFLKEIRKLYIKFIIKLDIENPIIRINTAFKGCSSLEKISVLPRIYHN